ncbi:MAG: hypothetical protein Q7J84_17480 [Sulfuricaulis sp.]|nr:hypothetical protein [Sulfuricaulis sp.]
MSKPIRFTDQDRYPQPYRKAAETDITIRFRRVRAEQAKIAEEQKTKVQALRRK